MKTEETPNFIQRHGVVDKIACTMSVNAHAFKLLARQYSDPIKAILQEIGCNAMDSHIRSGNTNPFQVLLPSRIDNHLRIRDYGTGMSEDKIRNVYANWMNSDKRSTNDEVGYFGIGSKTPLAYTDGFNITSYSDGVMRMYTLCRNEQDIPELQYYGAADTSEPNGVEISFAVKPEDFETFKQKAIQVYRYFPLQPIVNENPKFLPEVKINYQGVNWKMYADHESVRVVMGGVAYPVDNSVISRLGHDPIQQKIRNFFCYAKGLVFNVDIGTLDITPSREALELTPKTLSKIADCGHAILTEITDTTIKTMLSMENVKDLSDWSYHLLVREVMDDMGNLGIIYDRKSLERIVPSYPKLCQQSDDIECLGYYLENRNGRSKWHNVHGSHKISPDPRYKFVLLDELKGKERRLREYLSDNWKSIKSCYVIKRYTDAPLTRQDVMEYFGFDADDNCFIDMENLPVPPKTTRTRMSSGERRERKPKDMARVMRFDPSKYNSCDNKAAWTEEIIDPTDGIWYTVETHRWQLQGNINYNELREIMNACNIRVIVASDQKALQVPNVKPLLTSLVDLCQKKLDEPGYLEKYSQHFTAKNLVQKINLDYRRIRRLAENVRESALTPDHPLILIKRMTETVIEELPLADMIDVLIPNAVDKSTKFCGKTVKEWEAVFESCKYRYDGITEYNVFMRLIHAVDFYAENGKM